MPVNEYYESVSFTQGTQFNVSRRIDVDYLNRLHWHPFLEILVSLANGNRVSVNFTHYEMQVNDILLIYPGDLHNIEAGLASAAAAAIDSMHITYMVGSLAGDDTAFLVMRDNASAEIFCEEIKETLKS